MTAFLCSPWRQSSYIGVPDHPRPPLWEFNSFRIKRFLLFQYICIDADHVSENIIGLGNSVTLIGLFKP